MIIRTILQPTGARQTYQPALPVPVPNDPRWDRQTVVPDAHDAKVTSAVVAALEGACFLPVVQPPSSGALLAWGGGGEGSGALMNPTIRGNTLSRAAERDDRRGDHNPSCLPHSRHVSTAEDSGH